MYYLVKCKRKVEENKPLLVFQVMAASAHETVMKKMHYDTFDDRQTDVWFDCWEQPMLDYYRSLTEITQEIR